MFAIRAPKAFDGTRALAGGATVLVEGGVIVGVEPAAYDVPHGCPVTELPDTTVLPGLIDTHVHLVADGTPGALDKVAGYTTEDLDAVVTESLRASLAAGVTTVRDLGDRRFNVVERRDAQRAEDDGLPWILAAGPPITTVGGHCCYLGGEVSDPGSIGAALRERLERRVDVVKVMASGGVTTAESDMFAAQFDSDQLRTLIDTAHDAGIPVAAHAHAAAALDILAQLPVDTIEHATYLTRGEVVLDGLLGLLSTYATDDQLAALAAGGAHVCPTLGTGPTDVTLPPFLQTQFDAAGVTYAEFRKVRVDFTARMAEAGVRLVNGMDAGIAPPKAHGCYAHAVDDLAAAIGAEGALVASTSTAAEVCGVGSSKGRLRAGFDADLVVVRGDPLSEPLALLDVALVVLRGHVVTS